MNDCEQDIILSVSIAAYNVQDYLSEALESLVNLPEGLSEKIDVIVVNDGSSDNTLKIATSFQERFPNCITVIDKPNGGYGSTFNAALEIARGKYIRFLDGDDWFEPEGLAYYIDQLATYDVDAFYSPFIDFYEINNESKSIDLLSFVPEGEYIFTNLKHIPPLPSRSLGYKTDFLRKISFSMTEHCFYVDDEYACIPLKSISSFFIGHKPLYRYRIGREGQSISVEGIERHWEDLMFVCTHIVNELGENAQSLGESSYLANRLAAIASSPFLKLTSIPPCKEKKAALIRFNRLLKNYSVLFNSLLRQCSIAQILNKTFFLAYTPLCLYRSKK